MVGGVEAHQPVDLPELCSQQRSQMQKRSAHASHGGWVRRSRRIGDIRNGSLPVAVRLAQQLPGLLPTVEAIVT